MAKRREGGFFGAGILFLWGIDVGFGEFDGCVAIVFKLNILDESIRKPVFQKKKIGRFFWAGMGTLFYR